MMNLDRLFDMHAACCNCLSELSLNFNNGQTIIEANGIYIVAKLLFPENEEWRERRSFLNLQVILISSFIILLKFRYELGQSFSNIEIFILIEQEQ